MTAAVVQTQQEMTDAEIVLSAVMATNEGELLACVGRIFASPSDWYTRRIRDLIPTVWQNALRRHGDPSTLPSLVGAMRRYLTAGRRGDAHG